VTAAGAGKGPAREKNGLLALTHSIRIFTKSEIEKKGRTNQQGEESAKLGRRKFAIGIVGLKTA